MCMCIYECKEWPDLRDIFKLLTISDVMSAPVPVAAVYFLPKK